MITLKHLEIYNKYNHNYKVFEHYGQAEDKKDVNFQKWDEIATLTEKIRLKDESKLTKEEIAELTKEIEKKTENEDVTIALYSIAKNPIKPSKEENSKTSFLNTALEISSSFLK